MKRLIGPIRRFVRVVWHDSLRNPVRNQERYYVDVEILSPEVIAYQIDSLASKIKGRLEAARLPDIGLVCSSLAPFVWTFALTDPSDFDSFATSLKDIDGVVGVKKSYGPWEGGKSAEEVKKEKKLRSLALQDILFFKMMSREKRKSELLKFIKAESESMASDEKRYGSHGTISKLKYSEFKKFICSLGVCQVEARLVMYDVLGRSFLGYKRVVEEVSCGSEAIPFFERVINGTLHTTFQPYQLFNGIPFFVEYRPTQFAHLIAFAGEIHLVVGKYDLYIRGR